MKRTLTKVVRDWVRLLPLCMLLAAVALVASPITNTKTLQLPVAHADGQNPIQIENSLPGTPGWNDFSADLHPDTVSGYGSKISVNHGDSIDFFVTTTAATVSIDVFRTGYYGGVGARLITSLGSFPGQHQAVPKPDPVLGMISCNWTKTTTLTIPNTWVTGVYLAKLTASSGNQSFIFFVVRNDGGHEDIAFQTSVTTYQAYNTWGGMSLYNNNTDKTVYSYPHSMKVSFDRPFNPGDSNGAGHYFFWEYKFVYWAESQGYNLTYITDVDTHTNVNPLINHKAFLSVGHDEYWSKGMRDNVQNAINAGVNVAFFSANSVYWQIRFEPNAAGVPNRVEVGYKDFATVNSAPGPDPLYGVNNAIVTTRWRDDPVDLPENALLGVMYEDQVYQDYTYVVQNASNWVYAGTGFSNGSQVPGIVGYEYDRVWNNGFTPAGLTVLSQSPVVCCGGTNSYANSTLYTAPSGARVFAGGTIQWSLGLAAIQSNTYTNAGLQRTTANILNNFTSGSLPGVVLTPSSVSFGYQSVGTTSARQTLTLTNNSSNALVINGIALNGVSSGDFAQANTCPATLAINTSCTITVTFTPTANGGRNATLTVTDNAANSPQAVALSGSGITSAPNVVMNPTSLSFGNQNVGSNSTSQTITLTNNGSAVLTVNAVAISGANTHDFIQNNTCVGTVAINASCTINVTFDPTATGTRTAAIAINDNAPSSPQTAALSGTGVVGSSGVYFSDDFESGNLSKWTINNSDSTGQAGVQSTVVNSGSNALSLSNNSRQYSYVYTALPSGPEPETYTRFYFRINNLTYGTEVAMGNNAHDGANWEVDYDQNSKGLDAYFWNGKNQIYSISSGQNAISANTWYCIEVEDVEDEETNTGHGEVWLNGTSIGAVNADLSTTTPYARLMIFNAAPSTMYIDDVIVSSNYNGPINTSPAPAVGLNPSSVSFGNQNVGTTSGTQTVTVTNTGTATLTLSNVAVSGTNASDFAQSNTCPASLAVNASCTVSVTFTPGANGSRGASITLTDNAANSPQTVVLAGTGVTPAPAVNLNSATLNFGNQNVRTSSAAQTVTLTNSGTAMLAINSIAVSGTNASDFVQNNTCPATLAINASCTITVTFTPGANGNRSAAITVTDNGGNSPQSIGLSGTGITLAPGVNVNPTSVSFGNQTLNMKSTGQTITITNNGTTALTVNSIGVSGTNAGDFAQSNTCPTGTNTLAVNASCTITVTFTPTVTGSRAASVVISDNAAGSPQSVSLSGTGVTVSSNSYFSDGFESGNLSQWTLPNSDSTGSVRVQNAVVNSGNNALALSNSIGQYCYVNTALPGGPEAKTYTRFYFRISDLSNGTEVAIAHNNSGGNVWELDYDQNSKGLDIYFWNGANQIFIVSSKANTISANTWYSIEVEDNQATNGHGEVWINGTSVGAFDGNLSMTNDYGRLMLFNAAPSTIYIDDVIVSSGYNGPLH